MILIIKCENYFCIELITERGLPESYVGGEGSEAFMPCVLEVRACKHSLFASMLSRRKLSLKTYDFRDIC
jgi:hypothetical protein